MNPLTDSPDLAVERHGAVTLLEIRRPPLNFFDAALIQRLADVLVALDADDGCRAVVLAAAGKVFCAGADFGADGGGMRADAVQAVYGHAVRLFETRKPIVAAVQGPAIGGGLGLAMAADFRIAGPASRFSANFAQLGLHAGFGLTVTLPRAIGAQQAALLFYTGRRIDGRRAAAIGLADQCVDDDAQLRPAALALAAEIGAASPLAVTDMRQTLRGGLADAVRGALRRELACQERHLDTADFREGVAAASERRTPRFVGR